MEQLFKVDGQWLNLEQVEALKQKAKEEQEVLTKAKADALNKPVEKPKKITKK